MEVTQFMREKVEGKNCFMYYLKIGSTLGESKSAKGGVCAIKYRVRSVPIHDISFLEGTLNVYELIDQYFRARSVAGIA